MIVNPNDYKVGTKFICVNPKDGYVFDYDEMVTVVQRDAGRRLENGRGLGMFWPMSSFKLYKEKQKITPGIYSIRKGNKVVVQEVFEGVIYGRVKCRNGWINWSWNEKNYDSGGGYALVIPEPEPPFISYITKDHVSVGGRVVYLKMLEYNLDWYKYQIKKIEEEK